MAVSEEGCSRPDISSAGLQAGDGRHEEGGIMQLTRQTSWA